MLLLLWLLLLWRTISKSKYIRPSPAFRPFHTAKLCIVGLPVVVLCMLIFKPFCTCSITCDESQMNKASAVLFFFLLSCVALLKKIHTKQIKWITLYTYSQLTTRREQLILLVLLKWTKVPWGLVDFKRVVTSLEWLLEGKLFIKINFFFFNHKLKHHKLHIIKVSYTHTHTTDCFF